MSAAMETTGFVMAIISWLVTGTALANDHWKISTVSGNVITSQRITENLWHSCAENSASMVQCRDFESLLDLPSHIAGCRALMIISLLLGFASIIVSLLGLKCITVGSASDQSKAKMALGGGIVSILAGLCCLVACSWYAYRVVQDFYSPQYLGMKFELGAGLYLGWAAATLAILGGGFLCSAVSRTKSNASAAAYYGKAPQKIYTAKTETETAKSFV
ncbi:claudin 15-like a [Betta splendens]|uniref:Claudin n=1 Tax=Betta splendens TaxID=158456 RepID=A0A6P7L030_BETSP|nr:claudin 15-like a [Betta splendens]